MNVTTRFLPELSRAASSALTADSSAKGWKPIPQINQLHPQGADQDYVNGAYNCAPAVVAMLARGYGRQSGLSDADLIEQLGDDIVTKDGTDADGVARMLARADVPPAGEALGANYKDSQLKQHLNQGHMVIAQVRTSDPKGDQDSAHYVLVQGMTKDGNYIISDPLANKPYVATAQQLKEAVLKAPPDGGMLIPVASPAEARKMAKPTATATPVAEGKGPAAAPTAVGGTRAPMAALAPAPAASPAKAVAVPVDSFEAPDPKAFTVSDDVFEGVDTRYKEAPKKTNAVMQDNEKKNQFQLDVRYGEGGAPRADQTTPVTSDDKDADQFAQEIRQRKASGDMSAYDTLDKLEQSSSGKDRQVLEKVKEADKKDPGIGKKTLGDAF
ncbi:MAG: C39 family peptidase [Hyalangium sp.]|uniref:C39 family peptidase n=1 Tax=Hyalangium sp. TaxID=2028555 RepID=UPI00389ABCAA